MTTGSEINIVCFFSLLAKAEACGPLPKNQQKCCQQGREKAPKVNSEDVRMIKSGQHLAIRAGRKVADTTQAIGNMGHGEGERVKVEEGTFCNPKDDRIKKKVMRYRGDADGQLLV
jgi:hypothetical protein